jgi:hypothetical protein
MDVNAKHLKDIQNLHEELALEQAKTQVRVCKGGPQILGISCDGGVASGHRGVWNGYCGFVCVRRYRPRYADIATPATGIRLVGPGLWC